MKHVLFILGMIVLVTGCHTRREVVYTQPATRTVYIEEPAGAVIYTPETRVYRSARPRPEKLGELHQWHKWHHY
jgi:hypothetical protein